MKGILKIYFWQILSLVSGFATMFIVTPYLSSNQNYFGIYSFVISLNLFLSYADFGFLSAGIKYAAEAFIQKDKEQEYKILGFVLFIMFTMFALFAVMIFYGYLNPSIALKGIESADELQVAKDLLLIFLASLPITLLHRIIQLIFNIRLEDFKYQRVYAIVNLVKIGIAVILFHFFEYPIVTYYFIFQLLNLVVVLIGFLLAKKDYDYNFRLFFKYCKFNKVIYSKIKGLAYGSLILTISWVLYYEIDSIVIAKIASLKDVALFSVCLSLMTFARSLFGIIYNPFSVKFNHYIGLGSTDKLNAAYRTVILFGVPLSIFATLIVVFSMDKLILLWVGSQYEPAISIIKIMFLIYLFNFVTSPGGIAVVAKNKLKEMYFVSIFLPLIYWVGVVFTFNRLGILSFAIFKLVAFALYAIFYLYFSSRYMAVDWKDFVSKNAIGIVLGVVIIGVISSTIGPLLPVKKSVAHLLIYFSYVGGLFTLTCLAFFAFSKDFRNSLTSLLAKR